MTGERIRAYRGYVFDLDGTLYLDDELLPGAAETVTALRASGARLAFLTNKPLERGSAYAAKLTALGLPVAADEVVTSIDALLAYLAANPPAGPIVAVTEPLLASILVEAGYALVADDRPDAAALVVVAFDRTFDYAKLERAFRAVRAGARIVATNPDPWCPTADGGIPDCAAMLAAIEASTGARAEAIVGKPSAHMARTLLDRLQLRPEDVLVVGDRLLTDVALAHAAGMDAALVLTGATRAEDVGSAGRAPEHVLTRLRDLIPEGDDG
ncbi:MAG TPA: HAD-IIA family hydrolase [Candidatus Limnocylindrales bacterium]|nr:HAD-IIA family hydrolase [Candidatus Limnocylindrales bacterium]